MKSKSTNKRGGKARGKKKRQGRKRHRASAARGRRQLRRRKARLVSRLDRDNYPKRPSPVLHDDNICYEVSDRIVATKAGGVGVIHKLATWLKLDVVINEAVKLFKIYLPYTESDHILNIAYSFLAGGRCLEDIEVLRQDEAYMDMIGAERIPDPTTAGDFLRRFKDRSKIEALMDAINRVRLSLWQKRKRFLGRVAKIDIDGSLTPTLGEKKEGMGMSYKGSWSYHPLLVSLWNTQEPLYLENRPGNLPSHTGAVYWIDKAIGLCREVFDEVLLRGDTDFSLTENFDRWDEDQVKFVFGYDAAPNLVAIADSLPRGAWERLPRARRVVPEGHRRTKRENVKEEIVRQKEYENIRLLGEDVAEFDYTPSACKKPYRMIALRKNLSRERGERVLFEENRYFFYITNDFARRADLIVFEANERCDQEKLIGQLKSGVHALHNPAHDLNSNWAYMVIASLAWSLKAWYALMQPQVADRENGLRQEFKAFLNAVMLIPAQVLRTGRQTVVRLLAYTDQARTLLTTMHAIATMRLG